MKILLVKTSSLGDLIHTFPVLDYLRRRFPHGQIDWVVERPFAGLIHAHPQIDRVVAIESKSWRQQPFSSQTRKSFSLFRSELRKIKYDVIFDLQGNIKSSLVLACARGRKRVGFGWKSVPEWPNALMTSYKVNPPKGKNIREDYLAVVQGFFGDGMPHPISPMTLTLNEEEKAILEKLFRGGASPILICPSSAWPNKCLSKEQLISIMLQLKEKCWIIWGNEKEKELAIELSAQVPGSMVLERLSFPLLQQVMARCRLVISMDSLPLHLCGTTATPTFSFFGPSSARKYAPLGNGHRALQGECPYGQQFEKRCARLRTCATGACLKSYRCDLDPGYVPPLQ